MQHGGNDQSWKAMTPQINNSNVKVAFVFDAGLWRGGRNYLRSLLAAIRAVPGSSVTPVVFTDLRSEDLSREFQESVSFGLRFLPAENPHRWCGRPYVD